MIEKDCKHIWKIMNNFWRIDNVTNNCYWVCSNTIHISIELFSFFYVLSSKKETEHIKWMAINIVKKQSWHKSEKRRKDVRCIQNALMHTWEYYSNVYQPATNEVIELNVCAFIPKQNVEYLKIKWICMIPFYIKCILVEFT